VCTRLASKFIYNISQKNHEQILHNLNLCLSSLCKMYRSSAALAISLQNSSLGISFREVMVYCNRSTKNKFSFQPSFKGEGYKERPTIKTSHISYPKAIWNNLSPAINSEMFREYSRSTQNPFFRSDEERVVEDGGDRFMALEETLQTCLVSLLEKR
jgi:hypothetical protein